MIENAEAAPETTEQPRPPVPYYLHLVRANGDTLQIDVEETGWAAKHAEWMRGRSRWYLMRKADDAPILVVDVQDEDQPYYTARHILRMQGHNAGTEVICHGIGAKRADGHTDRMWILPTGLVCSGDDAEGLAEAIIDAL